MSETPTAATGMEVWLPGFGLVKVFGIATPHDGIAYWATNDLAMTDLSRLQLPERAGPEKPIPSFELTVKAPAIVYVRFSGAPPGDYLVCDEVRFTPLPDPAK